MKIDIYTLVMGMRHIKIAATQAKFADANCGKAVFKLVERSFIGIILSGLFLCFSVHFIPSAVAVPSQIAQMADANSQGDRLPPKVAQAVVADLAKLQKIPPAKLKVVKYSQESWSDGCLGLPQPEEICSQAIVEGWRVVVSDGSQEWVYRTDNSGRNVRLEAPKIS